MKIEKKNTKIIQYIVLAYTHRQNAQLNKNAYY